MNTYISLLRGINVSGQKKIKMAELKKLYESLSFENVSTYIQSGNVVFESYLDIKELQSIIETAIEKYFKFDVPVLILTPNQLIMAYKNLPFTTIDIEQEGSKIILFFLSKNISPQHGSNIQTYLTNAEQLVIGDGVIYLYCPAGLGKSKLTNKLIETKLQLTSTARNVKTVNKLLLLAKN